MAWADDMEGDGKGEFFTAGNLSGDGLSGQGDDGNGWGCGNGSGYAINKQGYHLGGGSTVEWLQVRMEEAGCSFECYGGVYAGGFVTYDN